MDYTRTMTATNHALSGALLSSVFPLYVAVPLAFASHFVLDSLPHYGIKHVERNHSTIYKLIVFGDTIVAISGFVMLLILHKWSMTICGLVAFSPDFLWILQYFKQGKNMHLQIKNRFMHFHKRIQRYERPWGIAVDMAATSIMLPLLILQLMR